MNKWIIKKKNWKVVIKRQLEDGDKCLSSIGSTENMLNESTCWPVWNGLQWQTDKEGYYGISLSGSKVGCTHIQLLWSRWVEGQVNLEQQEQNRLAEYKLLWSSRHSVWSHVAMVQLSQILMLAENQACQGAAMLLAQLRKKHKRQSFEK